MRIRFTRHAEEKFAVLFRHGVHVPKEKVVDTVRNPDVLDSASRAPLHVAQSDFDVRRVLRVVYRRERGIVIIITFYPGRKSQYGNE